MPLHRAYRFVAAGVVLTATLALVSYADAQTSRGAGASSGRYVPGASSSPALTAPLNTARPVPNPAQPTTPRSYQREYPREYTPLNPPDYRRFDLPGEWRD